MANGNITTTPPSWLQYLPMASGGLGAIGAIWSMIENIRRAKMLSDLRRYYQNQWQGAARAELSRLSGDAASRGWSGYPRGLAENVARAYAPYQLQAGQLVQSTIDPKSSIIDPFNMFLKSLEAVRSAYPQTKPSDTNINFQYGSTRNPFPWRLEGMQPITLGTDFPQG